MLPEQQHRLPAGVSFLGEEMNTQEKRCSKCDQVKSVAEFYPRSDRVGYRSACVECESKNYKERRQANLDHFRKLEKVRDSRYSDSHPGRRSEIMKRNYDKYRDDRIEYGRRHRQERPEVNRNSARKWKQEHKAEHKSYKSTYRARLKNAEGDFTAQQWKELLAKYDYTCLRCKRREPEIQLTPDHVIPLSQGGSNNISNIQPLCFSCNCSKSSRNTIDYR